MKWKMSLRSVASIVLAGGLLLGVLVGCAAEPTTVVQTKTTTASPTTVVTTVTAAPTSTTPPPSPPVADLRIALSELGTETTDPILAIFSMKVYMGLLYDTLVGSTPDAELSTETGLAHKWDISDEKDVWTFYLREGISFHNGDEVTAEDVKFSIERVISDAITGTVPAKLAGIVEEIEVVDSHTVTFKLNKPDGFFAYSLAPISGNEGMIVPKAYVEQVGVDEFRRNPVGSGPYRFVEQKLGESIKFEAVEDYWRGTPKWETVTFSLVPEESTRIGLLKTGEVDVISVSLESGSAMQEAGYNLLMKPGNVLGAVTFHEQWTEGNPLGNEMVREALSIAINREEILEFVLSGMGTVSGSYPVGTRGIGYVPLEPISYDPERAIALLELAGYADGFDIDLHAVPFSWIPEQPRIAQAVAGYWSEIGVRVRILPVEYMAIRGKWMDRDLGGTKASVFFFNNTPMSNTYIAGFVHPTLAFPSFDVPELTTYLNEHPLLAPVSPEQLEEDVEFVSRFIREHYLFSPLHEVDQVFATTQEPWYPSKIGYSLGLDYVFAAE